MTTSQIPETGAEQELRQAAITHLRKVRDLQAHLLAFVLVNLFLIAIWWFTSPDGFYWPMFPLFGWGIGLVFHVWDVFVGSAPSEEAIRSEMGRLSRR